MTILNQCQRDSSQLVVQHLKAKAELLSFYEKRDTVDVHFAVFEEAELFIETILGDYEWSTHKCLSLEVLEATMQLCA